MKKGDLDFEFAFDATKYYNLIENNIYIPSKELFDFVNDEYDKLH